ncbi:MAG: NAD(+) salvage pathway protein, partial [Piccolia ochrophora]
MAQTGLHAPFKPALLVVDYQEDFCPPSGSLAVTGGRDIATVINGLLQLPFALRVATKDWHPPDHISFADNHDGPDNEPFTSIADVSNPENPSETFQTRLWPVHCVQGSHGAQLIPELDVDRIDHVVEKGQDKRVEMYSAFRNPFRNPPGPSTGLPRLLKDAHISHV